MLKSSAKCEILTAHPTVNGFYEAKGVAGMGKLPQLFFYWIFL